jgi:hypothetical protein
MKNVLSFLVIALVAVWLMPSVGNATEERAGSASIPTMINYQGVLTDDEGNPLNGTYRLEFCIYTEETGGTNLWCEVHDTVDVVDGVLNVLLGEIENIPVEIFQHWQRWLGVTVEDDEEMTPRRRLTSVPYAYHAGYCGVSYYCPTGGSSVEIPFPHWAPFQVVASELGGQSEHTAWIAAGENDRQLSFVGIDGSGNVVNGTRSLYSDDTILSICPGLVLRMKGGGAFSVVLDASGGYPLESKAVLFAPHANPRGGRVAEVQD